MRVLNWKRKIRAQDGTLENTYGRQDRHLYIDQREEILLRKNWGKGLSGKELETLVKQGLIDSGKGSIA